MNYKLCELYNKDAILSKYTFHSNSFLFAYFAIALECWKCVRMRFHYTTVPVVLSIWAPSGNIADDAMQMEVHKTFYPSTLQRKCPMLQ